MSQPGPPLQVNAFVDGELDLAAQLEMEARVRNDPAWRAQVDEARRLHDALREGGDYHAAPPGLRERIAALRVSGQAPGLAAAPARGAARPSFVRRWFGWRPLLASMSLAALVAVAVDLAWLQASRDEQLGDEVVASHLRSTLGQHLVDVASSDHHTVKPFLSARLGFSPPVDELRLPGSVFLGGRVDYLDDRPVAALVYRQGEHIVNSFVWPGKGGDSEPRFSSARGYRTAHWAGHGMNHWVISDVNRAEFEAVVGAVRRLDGAP